MSNGERNPFEGLAPVKQDSKEVQGRGPKMEHFFGYLDKQNQPEVRAYFESLTPAQIQAVEDAMAFRGWDWAYCFGGVTAQNLDSVKTSLNQLFAEEDPKKKRAAIIEMQKIYQ